MAKTEKRWLKVQPMWRSGLGEPTYYYTDWADTDEFVREFMEPPAYATIEAWRGWKCTEVDKPDEQWLKSEIGSARATVESRSKWASFLEVVLDEG